MRHDEHYVEALAASAGEPVGRMVAIDLLDPNPGQPRQVMGDLSELMASVQEKGIIEQEYHRTVETVLRVSEGKTPAGRFPRFLRKLARRMPAINQAGRLQIDLLRRYRAAEGEEERHEALHRLLLSINCVAAGFGATG